jgi:hypothetical protein
VINSFSKYFGMTGWRLGWLVGPADAVEVMDRMWPRANGSERRIKAFLINWKLVQAAALKSQAVVAEAMPAYTFAGGASDSPARTGWTGITAPHSVAPWLPGRCRP